MGLSAHKVYVSYENVASVGKKKISKIMASGNVLFSSPGRTARGETGEYDLLRGELVLRGNVVLAEDGNVVKGNVLKYDNRSGRAEMVGDSQGMGEQRRGQVKSVFMVEHLGGGFGE
jgi:lipopolysaccharide export system protein LptA